MIPFLLLLILIVLIAILIVLIRCCCDPKPDPKPEPKELDHFRVFDVGDQDVSHEVELTGQFDHKRPQKAHVYQLVHFANPVQKNNHKIIDENAHLTWYRFEGASEPKREVKFTNQFGEQHWIKTTGDNNDRYSGKREGNSRYSSQFDVVQLSEIHSLSHETEYRSVHQETARKTLPDISLHLASPSANHEPRQFS